MQQGIISLDFLNSPAFFKHYVSGLFEAEDLLKVLISQLVVSQVGEEYIVPCVLEVSSVYPSPSLPRVAHSLHSSSSSPRRAQCVGSTAAQLHHSSVMQAGSY